ncbi:MAG: hypothetical protein CMN76_16070 [Spirochaetaceae bacterium]|nr:hypothetical protein [Spirochaetaceae bacterium]|tara:strand:+ start:25386 stop:26201 length:816 start_codon:yes stop_codon:yes gene_type:complete
MSARQFKTLAAVLLAAGLIPGALTAQTVGTQQTLEEKKPTPRDPTYTAPLVPPYLRELEPNAATQILLDPDSVREQSESYTDVEDRRREEIRTMNRLEMDGDRQYLEDRYLQQYGMDSYDYRFPYRETFKEDGWRRVQITFFLSLPITAGFTYGAMSLAKQSSGESNAFTGPQTAALAGFSILFSGLISWYDYENWKDWKSENEQDLSYLLPEHLKRTRIKKSRSSFIHPIWLPPAVARDNPGAPSPAPFAGASQESLAGGSAGLGISWRF